MLTLKPGSQAVLVKDVVARELLGAGRQHLLPADDADVVGGGELLLGGVGIPGVHVVDGPPGQDHVVERLLEGPCRQVHGPDGEQRQRVDSYHDDNK